jgi:hypothetical protein
MTCPYRDCPVRDGTGLLCDDDHCRELGQEAKLITARRRRITELEQKIIKGAQTGPAARAELAHLLAEKQKIITAAEQ